MIIDGKAIAKQIELEVREVLETLKGRKPTLAFVLVGDHPASIAYIKMKRKKCEEVGICSRDMELPSSVTQEELLNVICNLNSQKEVDGILVQLPLPEHIQTEKVLESVDPSKDVDGFHPYNMGKLLIGESLDFIPCTPYGIVVLLQKTGIDPRGKHVVIVGRSNIVGKPLAALLMQKKKGADATVTIAHSQTKDLSKLTRTADILIAAMGKAGIIKKEMIKPGAVVIDVGINRTDHKIVGDVDFDQVREEASHITPVPGGVGPMTIAMLLFNTLKAYQRHI